MPTPRICPLINHTKVPCAGEGKEGLIQGEEQMCRSIGGASYENCSIFSGWYWRTKMKTNERNEQNG